ncbi:hypothetical protein COCMIDRAFT_90605 [Bipolaris oryzae ATCC 44560]|uniref:Iron-sulfur cluster assembly factor IBA57 homolog, mitochondrial n=1 Tax=Bipolaris oryzae ATCC 44560 TaxID=930090 RepID=W6ZIU3_COCMI|nr:uncharacterized protein COCMIDRAFT_90605 [Bipolaris oryzae ATCC 44560]EUC47319.1 hypothetical protein COCMIDRAFT_90605 [Bipolaris oryzae ATCC 44560]
MAALTLSAPRRTARYICDTCRNSVRYPRNPAFGVQRYLGTAASLRSEDSQQLTSHQYFRSPAAPNSTFELARRKSILRQYSTSSQAAYATNSGFASLPHRRLIALSGPDTAKFLQGLITNNVDPDRSSSFYSAFLDARGRILWDVFVWVWPELVAEKGHWACHIEVDEGELEALKKHLKRHKLRSKIQIEEISPDAVRVWSSWGSAIEQANTQGLIANLKDPRAPNMHRYLADANAETIIDGAQPADVQEYHLQRYRNGIPEGQIEIPRESALPMECNIDLSQGIDFKKGCYVGQELTIRTKHTGIVRKRILPVELYTTATLATLPEHGTDIKQLDESGNIKKGRATGKFVAGIGNVGLAMCRLENMTHMKVSAEGGTWKPGMEFGCETKDGIVKIKPLLYDWFVLRERDLWDKNRQRL